ncbi:MAG TPA: peptidase M61, partial [Terriglobales bacterium]
QLGEDYYTESELIWLDADTKIRELTNNEKSLDDFAKAFFGPYNGSFVTYTYTFDDLVNTLNGVVRYDWATFLRERVYDLHPTVPEDGFTRGGYKLVYTDVLPPWEAKVEATYGLADFSTSVGFSIVVPHTGPDRNGMMGAPGSVASVWWESPAFKAGVTSGMQIVSVNGKAFSPEVLRQAILQAKNTREPLQIQFRDREVYKTIAIPCFDGLRVPSLQRVEATPARLDDILAPSKSPMPAF